VLGANCGCTRVDFTTALAVSLVTSVALARVLSGLVVAGGVFGASARIGTLVNILARVAVFLVASVAIARVLSGLVVAGGLFRASE